MDNSDKKRFGEIMMGMADNFRDQVTTEGLRLRFEILKPYTIGQVEKAAVRILTTRKYTKMPPVAEFIEAIEGAAPTTRQIADQEWGKVVEQIRAVGANGLPLFESRLTGQLIRRRFSWGALCRQTERELTWTRKEFVEAYEAAVACECQRLIEGPAEGKLKRLTEKIGGAS